MDVIHLNINKIIKKYNIIILYLNITHFRYYNYHNSHSHKIIKMILFLIK